MTTLRIAGPLTYVSSVGEAKRSVGADCARPNNTAASTKQHRDEL